MCGHCDADLNILEREVLGSANGLVFSDTKRTAWKMEIAGICKHAEGPRHRAKLISYITEIKGGQTQPAS
jgi:hypothetical protein